MASGSDSPPSSLLGSLQDDLFKCDGCGQCFQCKLDDSDYSSGTEQTRPFTCVTCDKDFPSEISYDLHVWEHHEEENLPHNSCDEDDGTLEKSTKRQELELGEAHSEGKEDTGQAAENVSELLVPPENLESPNQVYNKRVGGSDSYQKEIVSNTSLKRRICDYTSDSSTDTNDSLSRPTRAKNLKLGDSSKTLKRKGIFVQHGETKRKVGSFQKVLPSFESESDSDVSNILGFKFNLSNDYEADASSISTEDRLNTSYSSVEETNCSTLPIQLSESPTKSLKTNHAKRRKSTNRISSSDASCASSMVSPKPGPSGKSDERQRHSKQVEPTPSSSKAVDIPSTSKEDCHFQLSSGEAHNRQLLPNLEKPSTSRLEVLFNSDSSTLSCDSSTLSGDDNQTPPLSDSGSDQNDLYSSHEAKALRLRALLRLSPNPSLKITTKTDQSSISSCERGYQLSRSEIKDRPSITSPSNFSFEKEYETDPSTTSSGDHDYCIPSSHSEREHPKAMSPEVKGCERKALSPRSLEIQRNVHSGESSKKFKCSYCPKSYNKRWVLNEHIKSHTRETKPKCFKCGQEFSSELSLKEHERYVCGPDKIICEHCGRTFRQKSSLYRHMGRYHRQIQESKRLKDL